MNAPGAGRPCVLLLSGGLDSTTVLALAKRDGWRVFALSVRYGQRHAAELDAATHIARAFDVEKHIVANVTLDAFGGSALTDDIPVPKHRDTVAPSAIPVTYVPARNTVLLSLALAWSEVVGATDIFLGVNALDYSGYPDCRPEYVRAFETMANLATRAGVEEGAHYRIHIALSKAQIVALGTGLGVDYSATTSCYDPAEDGAACGTCDACQLRRKGFAEAGLLDPTRYAAAAT
jgi:7-cyano-7-deazaguanine synthase